MRLIKLNKTATKLAYFLIRNDWIADEFNGEYLSFQKKEHFSVDLNNDECVLIDDSGDFYHIKITGSGDELYTLFGLLFHLHQVDIGYEWID